MTTTLDPTLLPALDKIYDLLGQRPAAPVQPKPATDYHVECFKKLCERDTAVRALVQPVRAGNGDEWLRRVQLENAGQLDCFGE